MTKYAKLADGRELQFPDDLPDEEMHARVREHLNGERTRVEDVGLAGQRNKMLMALAQQLTQTNQLIMRLCQDQYRTHELLQQIAQVLAAPTRQKVLRADDGKIDETITTKEIGR
jgi:hypothetical protein